VLKSRFVRQSADSLFIACALKDKVPYISEQWTPAGAGLTDGLKQLGANSVRDLRQLHQAWHDQGASAGRFTKALDSSYNVSTEQHCI
jgi:hypothetical protein